MSHRATFCCAGLLSLAVIACGASEARAQQELEPASALEKSDEETRKTLFQWSSAPGVSGGPNLDEPIETDRPDFTEASTTVGRGVLQIESGYTYTSDNDGATTTRSHSFPEALFRYGIFADWLELRAAQNLASDDDGISQTTGAEDLYLGFKIGLTPQAGALPEMALIPQMTVPTGHHTLTADQMLPGVNWLYGWDINETISTGGSTQFNRAIDDTGDAYTEWAQSWTVGYSLTEKLGAYTECFAFLPSSADTAKPQYYFDGGFTYLLTDDIQWDIRGGVGLNDAADDFFVGTGLSVRFK